MNLPRKYDTILQKIARYLLGKIGDLCFEAFFIAFLNNNRRRSKMLQCKEVSQNRRRRTDEMYGEEILAMLTQQCAFFIVFLIAEFKRLY